MKKYHLTILRNNNYLTLYVEERSITSFLLFEQTLGNKTFVLYSREVSDEEFESWFKK